MWAWGFDVKSRGFSVGVLSDRGESSWATRDVDPRGKLRGAERLHLVRRAVVTFAEQMPAPTVAMVELPVGRFPAPSLVQASGVVGEAVWDVWGCPVMEATPTVWRLEVLGKGNADKRDALAYAASEFGYFGDDDNEAEALCIAAHALRLATASLAHSEAA